MKIRYGLLAFEFIILAFFALPVLSKIFNPGNAFGMLI